MAVYLWEYLVHVVECGMTHSFLSASLIALMLLCAGIEPNPGPVQAMSSDGLLYLEVTPYTYLMHAHCSENLRLCV